MLQRMCDWTNSRNGQIVMGVATLVGGLHLFFSESQPVLGMLDIGGITLMGKEIGVQQVLGVVLSIGGACYVWDYFCAGAGVGM